LIVLHDPNDRGHEARIQQLQASTTARSLAPSRCCGRDPRNQKMSRRDQRIDLRSLGCSSKASGSRSVALLMV
jgi:hypothetical protein